MRIFITTLSIIIAVILPTKGQNINSESYAEWWRICNDSTLNTLIDCALANNYDIIGATNNILLAKSNLRASQSGFYPSISLSGGYIMEKTSQGITDVDKRDQIGEVTLNATWEVDLFGSIRREVQSKRAIFIASEYQKHGVMVSLCGQIAEEYAKLRASQQKLAIARQNLESQRAITTLTEEKFSNGLVTALDAAQAKSLMLQTEASIPSLEYAVAAQINTLITLTGETSPTFREMLETEKPLAMPPLILYNGVDGNAIRKRPDIMVAESQLESLIKAAGAAKANYWPKFLVTAQFGYGSHQFSHFTDYENMVWQVEPAIKWNIFSGGEVAQAKRAALIQIDEGINTLNQKIRNALQDLENSLNDMRAAQEQLMAIDAALSQIEYTYRLAQQLYNDGLTDYQNVMTSQQSLLSAEENRTNALLALWQATASLYTATGGGWELIVE